MSRIIIRIMCDIVLCKTYTYYETEGINYVGPKAYMCN